MDIYCRFFSILKKKKNDICFIHCSKLFCSFLMTFRKDTSQMSSTLKDQEQKVQKALHTSTSAFSLASTSISKYWLGVDGHSQPRFSHLGLKLGPKSSAVWDMWCWDETQHTVEGPRSRSDPLLWIMMSNPLVILQLPHILHLIFCPWL